MMILLKPLNGYLKRVRGFVNPFHLEKPICDLYNIIVLHHNLFDLSSDIKVFGKYNQIIAQVHINNIVKQMNIKNGELIKQ